MVFQGFSGFGAPKIAPKSSQNRSEEALGHQVGPKRVPKVPWEALETLWKASGRLGKRFERPKSATRECEPVSAQLDPERRRGGMGWATPSILRGERVAKLVLCVLAP